MDDFINASGGPALGDAQAAQTQYYIDTVSGYIEDQTGTTFHLITDEDVRMKTDGHGQIILQFDPINDVTQIVDWKTQTVDDNWCWDGFALITGLCYFRTYVVTVSYGMSVVPDSIKGVCVEAVKRGLASNPTGLKMKTVGDVSYQYGDMLAFTDAENLILSQYTEIDMTTWSLATAQDAKGFNRRWPWANNVLNGPMGEFDD
jgi:hypothetical protein